jgi:hypothetical protein
MRMFICALALVAAATVHAQSPTYSRGEHVRVRTLDPASPPVTPIVLIVVGVPNDRLSVAGNRLYVNNAPATEFSPEFLARVAAAPSRIPAQVPEGHYFVMGEQRTNQDISEYWGQHSAVSLQPAR